MFFSSHRIHLLLQDVASIMNALNKKKCSAWVRWLVLFVCSFVQFSNIIHLILYLALCHAFTLSVILNLIILSQIRIGPISKNVLNHFPVFFSFSLLLLLLNVVVFSLFVLSPFGASIIYDWPSSRTYDGNLLLLLLSHTRPSHQRSRCYQRWLAHDAMQRSILRPNNVRIEAVFASYHDKRPFSLQSVPFEAQHLFVRVEIKLIF